MKRFLLFTTIILTALTVSAQIKCIEFLGIPFNVSYETFVDKLKSKGFTQNMYYERCFDGIIYERIVGVSVYPSSDSNEIENVAVYFTFPEEIFMHSFYNDVKVKLSEEYKENYMKETMVQENSFPCFHIYLRKDKEDKEVDINRIYGTITVLQDKVGEDKQINQLTILYGRVK